MPKSASRPASIGKFVGLRAVGGGRIGMSAPAGAPEARGSGARTGWRRCGDARARGDPARKLARSSGVVAQQLDDLSLLGARLR